MLCHKAPKLCSWNFSVFSLFLFVSCRRQDCVSLHNPFLIISIVKKKKKIFYCTFNLWASVV